MSKVFRFNSENCVNVKRFKIECKLQFNSYLRLLRVKIFITIYTTLKIEETTRKICIYVDVALPNNAHFKKKPS